MKENAKSFFTVVVIFCLGLSCINAITLYSFFNPDKRTFNYLIKDTLTGVVINGIITVTGYICDVTES